MGDRKVSLAKLQEMVVFSPDMVKAAHDAEAEYWEGINRMYGDTNLTILGSNRNITEKSHKQWGCSGELQKCPTKKNARRIRT